MTSMPMIVAEELDTRWENVIVKQGKLDEDAFKNPQFAGGSLSIKRVGPIKDCRSYRSIYAY